jgi:hypothetical protein
MALTTRSFGTRLSDSRRGLAQLPSQRHTGQSTPRARTIVMSPFRSRSDAHLGFLTESRSLCRGAGAESPALGCSEMQAMEKLGAAAAKRLSCPNAAPCGAEPQPRTRTNRPSATAWSIPFPFAPGAKNRCSYPLGAPRISARC